MTDMFRPIAVMLFLAAAGNAGAACWSPLVEESRLSFEIKQADAPLDGEFRQYRACICLDPEDPASATVRVAVETASADTQLPELDRELVGPDFFHSGKWPDATFTSDRVERTGEETYLAYGELTVRDVPKEISVPFEFSVTEDGQSASARGSIVIRRLDFGIGQGEWSDTRWVGNDVHVEFEVTLEPR